MEFYTEVKILTWRRLHEKNQKSCQLTACFSDDSRYVHGRLDTNRCRRL